MGSMTLLGTGGLVAAAPATLAWNTATAGGSVEFSGGDTVARVSVAMASGVSALSPFDLTKKTYVQVDWNAVVTPGSDFAGLANGARTDWVMTTLVMNGVTYLNGVSQVSETGVEMNNSSTLWAVDGPNQKYWYFNTVAGFWAAVAGADDPLTNTGGFSFAASPSGRPLYMTAFFSGLNDTVTIKTSGFTGTIATQVGLLNAAGWTVAV